LDFFSLHFFGLDLFVYRYPPGPARAAPFIYHISRYQQNGSKTKRSKTNSGELFEVTSLPKKTLYVCKVQPYMFV